MNFFEISKTNSSLQKSLLSPFCVKEPQAAHFTHNSDSSDLFEELIFARELLPIDRENPLWMPLIVARASGLARSPGG